MVKNLKSTIYTLDNLPPISRAISIRFETLTKTVVSEILATKKQAHKALMQVLQDPKNYTHEDEEQLRKGIKRMIKNLKLSRCKQDQIWICCQLAKYDAHLFPFNKLKKEGLAEIEGLNQALSELAFVLNDIVFVYDD